MNRKIEIAGRLREIRLGLYGDDGADHIAKDLGVPLQTWLNYERGVSMPAATLLELLVLSDVDPNWLLTGEGNRLRPEIFSFRQGGARLPDVLTNR